MKSKIHIILLFGLLVLTIILTFFTTFAWFSLRHRSEDILFTTGTVKVDANFYSAIDEMHQGLDFMSYDYIEHTGPMEFTSCVPGEIYTFKITVKNVGTIKSNMKITFDEIDVTINMSDLTKSEILSSFNLSYIDYTLPDDNNLVSKYLDEAPIVSLKNYILNANGELEFYFRIKIEGENTSNSKLLGVQVTIGKILVELRQENYVFN